MKGWRLIAPTAFKGTMTPLEAARFLARPEDRLFPLSDGGDGFLECLHYVLGGEWIWVDAADPFGRRRPVPVLQLPDETVALECAQVIGLAGLDQLDPLRASSLGLGELIAQFSQAPRLWIGLGGSATVDGGMDWPDLHLPVTQVFCDVQTDLKDAATTYGLQKGARPEDLPQLTQRLMSLGLPEGPRSGAAGGLGAKLLALGAQLRDGAEAILDLCGFDAACEGCEAVVTGEGRLDRSTLEGKLPFQVAQRSRKLGYRVLGQFGCLGTGWEEAAAYFDEIALLGDK